MAAQRVRAYIGLGANIGEPEATLARVVQALTALPGARRMAVSRLYATVPVGPSDQPEFRNAVVALDVPAGPDATSGALALLVALKALERAFGRRRRRRWGPRELDLDLLVFGRHRIEAERPPPGPGAGPTAPTLSLRVPHPAARDRLFVLAPLQDLAPGLRPPGWGETVVSAWRRRLRVDGARAARAVGAWDPSEGRWRALRAVPPAG